MFFANVLKPNLWGRIMSLPIIVFGFLVVIGIIVSIRLTAIGQSFQRVTHVLEPQADQAGQLIDALRERAREVERFLRVGDPDSARAFDDLVQKSDKVEQRLRELTVDQHRLQQLSRISDLGDTYDRVFREQILPGTHKQLQLAIKLLDEDGPAIAQTLADIYETARADDVAKVQDAANAMRSNFLVARIYVGQYLRTNHDDDAARFRLEMMAAESSGVDLLDSVTEDRRRAWTDTVLRLLTAFSQDFEQIVQLSKLRNEVIDGPLLQASNAIIAAVKDHTGDIRAELEVSARASSEAISGTRQLILVLGLVAIIVGTVLAIFIIRGITRPISNVVCVAREIAAGNLDNVITPASKDEVGRLMIALAQMQTDLRERLESDQRIAAENQRIRQALDNVSGNVMAVDADLNVIYINTEMHNLCTTRESDFRTGAPNFNASALHGKNIGALFTGASADFASLADIKGEHSWDVKLGNCYLHLVSNPIVDDTGSRLGTVIEWVNQTEERAVQSEVNALVKSARAGDLSNRLCLEDKSGFFAVLCGSLNELLSVTDNVVSELGMVVGAISKGDLSRKMDGEYDGEFAKLANDTNRTIRKLTEVIGEAKGAVRAVQQGASDISQGNLSLSERTQQQALALNETTSSMQEITDMVAQNADNAVLADRLSTSAQSLAAKGGEVVGSAVNAMQAIDKASQEISDIIGVIDEIAFQTNLLALNAAVEAARAGENGRGFAVVASEVRHLAQRSADAAREISALINDSVSKVQEGSVLVGESGETLDEIVTSVAKVSDVVAEIADASRQQNQGIERIGEAVSTLDEMTRSNASLVEQATAASETMSTQAKALGDSMSFFDSDLFDSHNGIEANLYEHHAKAIDASVSIAELSTNDSSIGNHPAVATRNEGRH